MEKVISLVEKASRALDERGKIPFSENDVKRYIKDYLKKTVEVDDIKKAVETLLIDSQQKSPMRKCIYRYKDGYSYSHVCSFGGLISFTFLQMHK